MPNNSTNSLADRIRSLLRPRAGSRAHLVPWAAGVALAIIAIAGLAARVAHHPTSAPAAATVAAAAPARALAPARAPTTAPLTAPVPSPRPRVVTGHPAPAAAPVAAQAAFTPPVGLVAGHLTLTRWVQNQYNQFAQVSRETITARTISVTAARAGGQASREVWSGWIRLLSPVTVVQVATSGTGGTVAVSADGTALGRPQTRGAAAAPDVMDYSLPLAPGWHQVRVAVTSFADVSEHVSASVTFGNGVAAPSAATPYAVARVTPAPTPASTVAVPPKPAQAPVKRTLATTVGAH